MSAPDHGAPPGHELRDVRFRGVLVAAAGVLALTLLSFILVRGLIDHYVRREAESTPPANPLAAQYAPREAPAPRLQTDPRRDLIEMRTAEDRQLRTYGWVDRDAGRVHIPIDRAMALTAVDGGRTP